MHSRDEYLLFVDRKMLNTADKNSLKESIKECKEFGPEAEIYLNSQKVVSSVIFEFLKLLSTQNYPIMIFRETDRYKFMLYLSIQQTWNRGLGDILMGTTFVCITTPYPKGRIAHEDAYGEACKQFREGINVEEITKFLLQTDSEKLRWCSFTQIGDRYIICSYIKKGNKFKLHKTYIYDSFSQTCQRYFNTDSKQKLNESGVVWEQYVYNKNDKRMREFRKRRNSTETHEKVEIMADTTLVPDKSPIEDEQPRIESAQAIPPEDNDESKDDSIWNEFYEDECDEEYSVDAETSIFF